MGELKIVCAARVLIGMWNGDGTMEHVCNLCGKKGKTDKIVPKTWGYVTLYKWNLKAGLIPDEIFRLCPNCIPVFKGMMKGK